MVQRTDVGVHVSVVDRRLNGGVGAVDASAVKEVSEVTVVAFDLLTTP